MKNLKKITLSLILLLSSTLLITTSQAQIVQDKINFNTTEIADFDINYFKVYEANNLLYFKFLILENSGNIAYVLESSTNGIDYRSLQIKEGFQSPKQTPLLYCYTEPLNKTENTYYRIKRVLSNGESDYSQTLTIKSGLISNRWFTCNDEYIIVANQ